MLRHAETSFKDLKQRRLNGFNAMFAVQSVEAAKLYYEEFQNNKNFA